ncbi:DUF305 domain-containing protein [Actinomadura viridis]|uniref:Uncharacterized protein (DUF305 family) n=1 Tax=Actinomadura viridis TaxID=58110 RepID=A0A931DDX7_9ACTN|nr:DUF305 domain-containing protein [Actinomadura viridis]MBG6087069.1 uncharacterized protein (DUF305 family) [Actinomadura viridis]
MRKLILVAGAVALVGTAACGGGDEGTSGGSGHASPPAGAASSTPAARHNAQDVKFAQMMIPHHRQAVEMSKVVAARSGDPEVKRLAGQIERAQAPEISTMTGWLRQWGATVPPEDGGAGEGGHGGMDHGGMDHGGSGGGMPGMMTGKQMADLGKATGAALDRMFLTMMIEHHEGAVVMAREEQSKGAHPDAKAMAAAIVRTQQTEIATMRGMLGRS